jgi:hypothetical protein
MHILTTRGARTEWLHTFVFLSTHSKQDSVGLFRFCFFFGGSPVVAGDAVLLSRSLGEAPSPALGPWPSPLPAAALACSPWFAAPHNAGSSSSAGLVSARGVLLTPRRSGGPPPSDCGRDWCCRSS